MPPRCGRTGPWPSPVASCAAWWWWWWCVCVCGGGGVTAGDTPAYARARLRALARTRAGTHLAAHRPAADSLLECVQADDATRVGLAARAACALLALFRRVDRKQAHLVVACWRARHAGALARVCGGLTNPRDRALCCGRRCPPPRSPMYSVSPSTTRAGPSSTAGAPAAAGAGAAPPPSSKAPAAASAATVARAAGAASRSADLQSVMHACMRGRGGGRCARQSGRAQQACDDATTRLSTVIARFKPPPQGTAVPFAPPPPARGV
jgi:hypothetical protein